MINLLLATLLIGTTSLPNIGDDNKRIEGKWKATFLQSTGDPNDSKEELVLHFKAGKISATLNGNSAGKGQYKLIQDKKPRWIDIKLNDLSFRGIYKIEKDKLHICHGEPGDKQRPKRFATNEDGPYEAYFVLERLPKK